MCRASGRATPRSSGSRLPAWPIETGRPVVHVAAEIGVGEQLLGRWGRRVRDRAGGGDPVVDVVERAELERLRRENADLRLDREFLKKAAAFSHPSRTGRRLPADRSGEGRLPNRPDVPAAGGVAVGSSTSGAPRAVWPDPGRAAPHRTR